MVTITLQNKAMIMMMMLAAIVTITMITLQLPQTIAIASSLSSSPYDHHQQKQQHDENNNNVVVIDDDGKSPYADDKYMIITSMTDKDLQSLQNGTGEAFSGLAKLAELNGYPGPRHVLDMASELKLDAEQKEKVDVIYQNMRSKAKEIGAKIIAIEKQMDDSFANKTMSANELEHMLDKSASYYSQLRYVHLSAHIETANVLKEDQINMYNNLRGYQH